MDNLIEKLKHLWSCFPITLQMFFGWVGLYVVMVIGQALWNWICREPKAKPEKEIRGTIKNNF